MSRTPVFCVLLAVAALASPLSARAFPAAALPNEGLVMFDENPFNGSPRGFYRYDVDTGQLSLITEVPMTTDRLTGFAWHSHERRVYAGSEQGRLYTIELLTGEVDLVGQVPTSAQFPFIRGLTFEPNTHRLLGMGFGPQLYEINPATAASNLLGTVPALAGGMAFTPDGTLYGWTPVYHLMEINPVTLEAMVINPSASMGAVSNLTAAPDGTLYGSGWQQGGVIRIDPAIGTGQLIAQYPEHVTGVIGVFYYAIPEPSSAALGVGAIAFEMYCARAQGSYKRGVITK